MNEQFQTTLQQAEQLLKQGDLQEAFRTFHPILSYPGQIQDSVDIVNALRVLADISAGIIGDEFAQLVRVAVDNPQDTRAHFKIAYTLFEQGAYDMAATLLAYAHALQPNEEGLLTELVVALEYLSLNGEACKFLRARSESLQQNFLCNYLLALNSLMIGDLETPHTLLPTLQQNQEERLASLVTRIANMLKRADAISAVRPLDDQDLRGWHFVLSASFLLHLSPYGLDEGMNGRYAFVQDTASRCLEGMQRLEAILRVLDVSIPRVFLLPGRNSAILAHALAERLHVPLVPWTSASQTEDGIIVAYDLSELDKDVIITLHQHRPGQIVWSHATCWTEPFPFVADVTTYLYQTNCAPWESHMTVDPETGKVVMSAVDERNIEIIAAELLQSQLDPDVLQDLPALQSLVQAAALIPDEAAAGICATSGLRERQWSGSPVKSSRFS